MYRMSVLPCQECHRVIATRVQVQFLQVFIRLRSSSIFEGLSTFPFGRLRETRKLFNAFALDH